ncbi:MAG: membrane protein insertion efficiency factor YidD [Paracoccaceae bacterium]|nr:membrane protein insertion efficiency factor YidD [Paracoccaceae bacterium]
MKNIRKIFVLPIYLYQVCISPFMGRNCRFEPTCSQYFRDAIIVHGLIFGSFLGFKRIFRCHPFGSFGYDPVPKKKIKK